MQFDEENLVLVRVNDVVIGAVAGAICAVLAAAFEAGILAFRFFTIGHFGGDVGSGVAVLALTGAVLGGLVGLSVRSLFGRREAPSRAR
jgi:hypothetical protein